MVMPYSAASSALTSSRLVGSAALVKGSAMAAPCNGAWTEHQQPHTVLR